MRVDIFFSYAHEDEALRDELEKHLSLLKRQQLIDGWHDRKITAGQDWASAIDEHVNSADIILLLVSPDFLASDYCYEVEMQTALRRHQERAAIVIPIILRPVDWSGAPFGHLQALPRDGRPVTSYPDRDEAFRGIAQGIRDLVGRRAARPPGPLPRVQPQRVQPQTEQRVLDAAMPGRVVKGRTTELQTLIRLPESPGLKGILQADSDAEPRPEDVVSKAFPVTFPRSLGGEIEGFTAQVTLTGPDFAPPTQTKRFVVPPGQDSEVVTFLLTPQRTGKLKILVELQWEEAVRGTRRLLTECVADASALDEPPPVHVVQMSLAEHGRTGQSERVITEPSPRVTMPSPAPQRRNDDTVLSAPTPQRRGSRLAWLATSGTVAAALVGAVFVWQNAGRDVNVGSVGPASTHTLRIRVVDPATGLGLSTARVVADTEAGPRVGETDSEGYFELTVPKTYGSVRLRVSRDDYQSVEQHVVSVPGSTEAAVVRLPRATATVSDRVIWEKNWQTINQPRPQLGSSRASSRSNTALLQVLNGLDLTTAPDLAEKRDQLVALVNRDQVNAKDPRGGVRYTPQIRAAESELKRAIRTRAIEHGAAVAAVQ